MHKRTFTEIVLSAFSEFNNKSSQIRTNALTAICTQLQQTHNPEFLAEHADKIAEIVHSSLESNIPSEIDAAAVLLTLVAIQLPENDRSFHQAFYEPLLAIIRSNHYVRSSVRFSVFHATAVLIFLYEKNGDRLTTLMEELQQIFLSKTYPAKAKLERDSQSVAAFETWIFLVTLLQSRWEFRKAEPVFRNVTVGRFISLLEAYHYNVRVVCCKATAVIMEGGRESDRGLLQPELPKILIHISRMMRAWQRRTSELKSPWEVHQYLEVDQFDWHKSPAP